MSEEWKRIQLDDPSEWPKHTKVDLDGAHADERGAIQSLVNFPVKNVSLITSRKATLRSNHYHKTDWHYMYMVAGSAGYYYRPTGSLEKPKCIIFRAGELVFTPPMEDHATIFLEDSTLLVMSRNPRDQESYESDVVRIVVIDPLEIDRELSKLGVTT